MWGRTEKGDYLNHTGFLSLDLRSFAAGQLIRERIPAASDNGAGWLFAGGFPEADRQVLFFLPSYMGAEDLEREIQSGEGPITCIRVKAANSGFHKAPTHRDYLGSLMNLGITREQIGDIICRENEAFVFAVRETAPFICSELTRVRHTKVTAEVRPPSQCPCQVNTKAESGSVSSERVDCLAAHVFHLSRSQAQRLIEQEKVFADGRIITSASYTPSSGEKISVRGYGKFRYLGTDGKTRKGRLIARYERYV